MHPSTQGRFDLNTNDFEQLRASRSIDWAMGCFRRFTPTPVLKFIRIVRILPPPRLLISPNRNMQTPNVLTTRATRKTTRFGARDAKCNAAGARHRASMGATDGQRNWPKMRKTLGKPGFHSGEDRIRTCGRILLLRRFSKPVLSTTQPPLRGVFHVGGGFGFSQRLDYCAFIFALCNNPDKTNFILFPARYDSVRNRRNIPAGKVSTLPLCPLQWSPADAVAEPNQVPAK